MHCTSELLLPYRIAPLPRQLVMLPATRRYPYLLLQPNFLPFLALAFAPSFPSFPRFEQFIMAP